MVTRLAVAQTVEQTINGLTTLLMGRLLVRIQSAAEKSAPPPNWFPVEGRV